MFIILILGITFIIFINQTRLETIKEVEVYEERREVKFQQFKMRDLRDFAEEKMDES